MTDSTPATRILVLPDREAAEEAATELVERFGLSEPPRPLREALAGEDDAEDAQWLVVLEAHQFAECASLSPGALENLAAEYDGWLERE